MKLSANSSGFTLLEMIIVMTIIVIILSISFVGFGKFLGPKELQATASQFQQLILLSRQVSSNLGVNVILQVDKTTNEIRFFKDLNNNRRIDGQDEESTSAKVRMGDKVKIEKSPDAILFLPTGYSDFIFTETERYDEVDSLDFDSFYAKAFTSPKEFSFEDDSKADLVFMSVDGQYKLCLDYHFRKGIVKMEQIVK
ncbi:MAG: prepilin-type N-terminal cleavage/methylation domain-containing protein [Planctomycetes bacterium]|nr:prepilin-type N-terminal cleavage/methylation domain-containing protein [Planctomycetota bacterium]